MSAREAACHCGQLRLEVTGDPFVVSICHCLDCQRRTGSAFGMQSAFKPDQVEIVGPLQRLLAHLRRSRPEGACLPLLPRMRLAGLLHRADGAGSDRHLGRLVRRSRVPAADRVGLQLAPARVARPARRASGPSRRSSGGRSTRSTSRAGTQEAADRGRELLDAHPQYPDLAYNVACCESLAGRPADAIEHLLLAIDGSEQFRAMAAGDSDFDPIRDEPEFKKLVG